MDGMAEILTCADILTMLEPPPMFNDHRRDRRGDFAASSIPIYVWRRDRHGTVNMRGIQPDADNREPWFLCYS